MRKHAIVEYVVTLRFKDSEVVAQFPDRQVVVKSGDLVDIKLENDFDIPSGWKFRIERYGITLADAKRALDKLTDRP